jgi:uncharacterized protein
MPRGQYDHWVSVSRRLRTVEPVVPTKLGTERGLAYSVWLPPDGGPIAGGVVILHGAGSAKESHYDYARLLRASGFAALSFDQRGHGESDGPMDGRALEDVAAMAELLRSAVGDPAPPIALRGSSMGGCLAILAAPAADARAVVAICPASTALMRRSLRSEKFTFEADIPALDAFLAEHDLDTVVAALDVPLLLLHAEGDEQVPVAQSRELAGVMRQPSSRLITVPGGHHRSVQHDGELQAVSLRFIARSLGAR